MTCRHPTKKAYFQDNIKLQAFMHETYPEIAEKAQKEEIELFYISPYSPEINPDEYLNHNLKQNIHSGIMLHTKKQIRRKTEAFQKGILCPFMHSCVYPSRQEAFLKGKTFSISSFLP